MEYALWIGVPIGIWLLFALMQDRGGGEYGGWKRQSAVGGWLQSIRSGIANRPILTVLLVFLLGSVIGYGVIGDGNLPDLPNDAWEQFEELRRKIFRRECLASINGQCLTYIDVWFDRR